MKTIALVLALVVIAGTGCATRYNITLGNGEVITSKGRPHLSPDKAAWVFTDPSGKTRYVPAGSVAQIAPQSMDDGGPAKWQPASSR
jgi:hypothetical protein